MNTTEYAIRKNIGSKIKLARTRTNYTQEKLAEKLQLSTRYISQLERGIAFGSATTIVSICKALNISSDFLFHDVINSENSVSSIVDDKFLHTYSMLNDYNKEVLNSMAKELVNLQSNFTEEEMRAAAKDTNNFNKYYNRKDYVV